MSLEELIRKTVFDAVQEAIQGLPQKEPMEIPATQLVSYRPAYRWKTVQIWPEREQFITRTGRKIVINLKKFDQVAEQRKYKNRLAKPSGLGPIRCP